MQKQSFYSPETQHGRRVKKVYLKKVLAVQEIGGVFDSLAPPPPAPPRPAPPRPTPDKVGPLRTHVL